MTEIRKLVNFTCPASWDKNGKYHISFAYYDERLNFTGKSEGVELTEEELYIVLKPHLQLKTN